jgi:hypothetical protein
MAQFSRYKLAENAAQDRPEIGKKRVREMVKKLPTAYKDNYWKSRIFVTMQRIAPVFRTHKKTPCGNNRGRFR